MSRQTDRNIDRGACRQTDGHDLKRQTDRQADRNRQTEKRTAGQTLSLADCDMHTFITRDTPAETEETGSSQPGGEIETQTIRSQPARKIEPGSQPHRKTGTSQTERTIRSQTDRKTGASQRSREIDRKTGLLQASQPERQESAGQTERQDYYKPASQPARKTGVRQKDRTIRSQPDRQKDRNQSTRQRDRKKDRTIKSQPNRKTGASQPGRETEKQDY